MYTGTVLFVDQHDGNKHSLEAKTHTALRLVAAAAVAVMIRQVKARGILGPK